MRFNPWRTVKRTGISELSARIIILLFAFLVFVNHAWTQEACVLGGVIKNTTQKRESSLAVQVEMAEPWGELFALTLSYVNEGHLADHHRDGVACQLWISHDTLKEHLSFSAGCGPYAYFDTTSDASDAYVNNHGMGIMTSLATTYCPGNKVFFQVRSNWVITSDMNTLSVMLGSGYRFGSPHTTESFPEFSLQKSSLPRNEITVLTGRTIVNSFGSELSSPLNVEYRRKLWRHVEWTVAGLYEGCNTMINRYGPVTQLWIVNEFFKKRLVFGGGAGCYYACDRKQDAHHGGTMAGIISATAAYRLLSQWNARVTFNRILTDYNRDSDVLLLGVGYIF